MRLTRRAWLAGATLLAGSQAHGAAERLITGVNLAGLEFATRALPGRLHHNYVAPTVEELDYYRGCGARAVRVPFRWERLQPDLDANFDAAHWRILERIIRAAAERDMRVILDPHQYGRRIIDGAAHVIGESSVTAAHFAAFWAEIARRCAPWPQTIFGLQNEPHDQNTDTLVATHNTVIAAIRATGATQLILVPGNAWTGAHSWVSSGNGRAMLGVRDPSDNMAFDVHQFLDANSSGTSGACARGAGRRLDAFARWAREHGKRGFLGEFGGGVSEGCLNELTLLLEHIAANRDAWLGWTCWAGGPWWPDDYHLTLEPASLQRGEDRPQMRVLRRYFE